MTMFDLSRIQERLRGRRVRMWWLAAASIPLVCTGAYSVGQHVMSTGSKAARMAGAPIPVATVTADTRRVADVIGASGAVTPSEVVRVTVKLPDVPVRDVKVDFGTMVAAGSLLAEHDSALLQSALSSAEARFVQRQADLRRAEARHARLRHMQQDLSRAVARSADSGLEQSASDRERAARKLESITAIHRQGLLPRSDVDAAQADLDRAVAQLRRSELARIRADQDLAREIDVAAADADAARSALGLAQDELSRARTNFASVKISSPVAGVVTDRDVNAGEIPTAHKPIFTIGRIDEVLVAARVSEEQIANVRVGDAARVTFNAFPNEVYDGSVKRIKPASIEDSRTFEIGVLVKNPQLRLKPGLTAFVRIANERTGLMVPEQTIVRPTGSSESAVFVVKDDVARLAPVKVRPVGGGWIEVVDGLRPGAQVVSAGHLDLRDGDAVRVGAARTETSVAGRAQALN